MRSPSFFFRFIITVMIVLLLVGTSGATITYNNINNSGWTNTIYDNTTKDLSGFDNDIGTVFESWNDSNYNGWTLQAGQSNSFVSGKLKLNNSAYYYGGLRYPRASQNHSITGKFNLTTELSTRSAQILVRYVDTSNYIVVEFTQSTQSIFERINNAWRQTTTFNTTSISNNTEHTFFINVDGSRIIVKVDEITITNGGQSINSTALSSSSAVGISSYQSTSIFDDFQIMNNNQTWGNITHYSIDSGVGNNVSGYNISISTPGTSNVSLTMYDNTTGIATTPVIIFSNQQSSNGWINGTITGTQYRIVNFVLTEYENSDSPKEHDFYVAYNISPDTIAPTYSGATANQTTVGIYTNFSIQFNDNLALHPNGYYLFSTNNSGLWVNSSWVSFTSTPQTIYNNTIILNSTPGIVIGYRWYANDSSGNVNNTPIYTITTTQINCTDIGSDGINNSIIVISNNSLESNCYTNNIDDNIEFQYAFTNASNNSIVQINSGTYTINGTMVVNNTNVTIKGNGTNTKVSMIEQATAAAFPQNVLILNLNAANQTIQDIWFYGNRYNSSGSDVQGILADGQNYMNFLAPNANNQTIKNLTIESFICDGIRIGNQVENLLVTNNTLIDISHSAIQSSAFNSTIENNTIKALSAATHITDAGIRIYDAYGTIFQNNEITRTGTARFNKGFEIHSYGNKTLKNLTIKNNTIMVESHHGIWFDSAGGSATTDKTKVTNIIIEHNKIDAPNSGASETGAGIKVDGASVYNNVTIQSNSINHSYQNGITISNLPADSTDIIIKNNIITNTYMGYGIYNTSPVTISYNDVWNNLLGSYANTTAGVGDISTDPLYISLTDFHLKSQYNRWNGSSWVQDTVTSPAIRAGDPTSSNTLSPWGGVIEMGAYGNTAEASQGKTINVNPSVAVGVAAMGIAVSIAVYTMYRRRGRPPMMFILGFL